MRKTGVAFSKLVTSRSHIKKKLISRSHDIKKTHLEKDEIEWQ